MRYEPTDHEWTAIKPVLPDLAMRDRVVVGRMPVGR